MYRIPSTLKGDLDYTQSLIDQFKAGEIQTGQLKSNRVPMESTNSAKINIICYDFVVQVDWSLPNNSPR